MSDASARALSAEYMRRHRAAWKEGGFAPISIMVHDDDRVKMAAYGEVTKFEKMLELIKAGDEEGIYLASTRNAQKLPAFDLVEEVKALIDSQLELPETRHTATHASALLSSVKNYATKARQNRMASELDPMDDMARALAVVYSNLAVAVFKLADALAHYAPQLGEDRDE
jgi:prophage DNA circulation protein